MSGSHPPLGGGAVPKSGGRFVDASPGSSSDDERFIRDELNYSSSTGGLGGSDSTGKKSGNYLSYGHLRSHRGQAFQLSPKSSTASHKSSIISSSKDDSQNIISKL